MDESTLTRKAIEEIVREMQDHKEQEQLPQERKKNPLGKLNKRFLGRTLNSMITHNKREDNRTHESCQRKLRELDNRRRKRHYEDSDKNRRERTRSSSESSHEVYSSSSSDEGKKNRRRSKYKKKKLRRRSRNSTGSSDTGSKSWHGENQKSEPKDEAEYAQTAPVAYYEASAVNNMVCAMAAYNQINQYLQYQTSLKGAEAATAYGEPTGSVSEAVRKDEDIEASVSLSDSISLASSTSLLSFSTYEEDENGVPTINVSSDEGVKRERRRTSDCDMTTKVSEDKASICCISVDSSSDTSNSTIGVRSSDSDTKEMSQGDTMKVFNRKIICLKLKQNDSNDGDPIVLSDSSESDREEIGNNLAAGTTSMGGASGKNSPKSPSSVVLISSSDTETETDNETDNELNENVPKETESLKINANGSTALTNASTETNETNGNTSKDDKGGSTNTEEEEVNVNTNEDVKAESPTQTIE